MFYLDLFLSPLDHQRNRPLLQHEFHGIKTGAHQSLLVETAKSGKFLIVEAKRKSSMQVLAALAERVPW